MPGMTVCILDQPRTGSHVLASLLKSNGIGKAGEIFRHSIHTEIEALHTLDEVKDYVQRRLEGNAIEDNCSVQFCKKQLDMLIKRLRLPRDQSGVLLFLKYVFGDRSKYISLYRSNQVQQAISLLVAQHNDVYQYHTNIPPINTKMPYRYSAIESTMNHLRRDYDWQDINGVLPVLTVSYEDLCRNVESTNKTMGRISEFLEFSLPVREQNEVFKVVDHCKLSQESQFVNENIEKFFASCHSDSDTKNRIVTSMKGVFKFS